MCLRHKWSYGVEIACIPGTPIVRVYVFLTCLKCLKTKCVFERDLTPKELHKIISHVQQVEEWKFKLWEKLMEEKR